MNKLLIILFTFGIISCFWGCKKYDDILNNDNQNYMVNGIYNKTSYTYPVDTLFNFSISFNMSVESIVNVEILDPDGNSLNKNEILLAPNQDRTIFTGNYRLSETYANGNYSIIYSLKDIDGANRCAFQSVSFNNGQSNMAPVISDVTVVPDTLTVTAPTPVLLTLKAVDQNGQNDISEVYFITYRPDGTTSASHTSLYDDGLVEHGDAQAGDSVYSRIVQVDQNNTKGIYKFEFAARDRGNKLSNIISHNILIK